MLVIHLLLIGGRFFFLGKETAVIKTGICRS
uniref:Uncharacterized protein n=1 Tax=Anguilla anguilla TaxID=7936 RepID=A0A0E9TX86_ANGAN